MSATSNVNLKTISLTFETPNAFNNTGDNPDLITFSDTSPNHSSNEINEMKITNENNDATALKKRKIRQIQSNPQETGTNDLNIQQMRAALKNIGLSDSEILSIKNNELLNTLEETRSSLQEQYQTTFNEKTANESILNKWTSKKNKVLQNKTKKVHKDPTRIVDDFLENYSKNNKFYNSKMI